MSQSHIGDNNKVTDSFNNNTSYSHSTNCGNTDNSTHNVNNYTTIVDEKKEILDWLSPLNYQKRYNDIRARRVGKVGG